MNSTVLLRLVAAIQIVLGVAYLAAPGQFLSALGHTVPQPDLFYPLGMLSSRFLVYGVGLWLVSASPGKHILWIRLMAAIQSIDLAVGIYYTATGVVPLALSGFPMFNAVWIGLSLALLRVREAAAPA